MPNLPNLTTDPSSTRPDGGSSPLTSLKRVFVTAGSQSIQCTQYRGLGSPPSDLGRPGDIFIDLSPKAYKAFVRYDTWKEWPGLYREVGTGFDPPGSRFTHPQDSTRIMWCTRDDMMWYKNDSIRKGRKLIFSAYPNAQFISAHELIQRSEIASHGFHVGQKRVASNDNPNQGTAPRKRRGIAGEPDQGLRSVHAGSSPPNTADPHADPETLSSQNTLAGTHEGLISESVRGSNPSPPETDIRSNHPPLPPSASRHSGLDISAEGGQSQNLPVFAHQRQFQTQHGTTIRYIQFRGYGSPPPTLGKPGDMFLDMSPGAYRLFVKYTTWIEWTGAHRNPTSFHFRHPCDNARVVWCTYNDVLWFKTVSLSSARTRLFRSIASSSIPAHRMITRSGILTREVESQAVVSSPGQEKEPPIVGGGVEQPDEQRSDVENHLPQRLPSASVSATVVGTVETPSVSMQPASPVPPNTASVSRPKPMITNTDP